MQCSKSFEEALARPDLKVLLNSDWIPLLKLILLSPRIATLLLWKVSVFSVTASLHVFSPGTVHFFLKGVLVFWKSIYSYFWSFFVSRIIIYGVTTNYRGIFMVRMILFVIFRSLTIYYSKRFGEYILSAALFIFPSKEDFVIFFLSLNLVSGDLASSTFRHIS